MTFKAAVADLPLGGGKGVIMAPADAPLTARRRRAALLDFGDLVESAQGRYITAEDVGTSSRDMAVIAQQTGHVAGLARSRGGSGDPSPFTALGVEAAIRATCRARLRRRLAARPQRSACSGSATSARGWPSAAPGPGRGSIVADVDPRKQALAAAARRQLVDARRGAGEPRSTCSCRARWAACSTTRSVPRLRCRAIAGAANNQLADDGIAALLQERGILWAPDFVANAGGIINIAEEAGGYDPAAARQRVRGIGDTLRDDLRPLRRDRETPLAAAMELARGGWRARRPPRAAQRGSEALRASGPGRSTPAGSRPSAWSLSRWAASVTVAAGRSGSGTSSHAASSNSSTVRAPASRPSTQTALALEPVRDVLVELGGRIAHRRPVARAAAPTARAGAARPSASR